MSRSASDLVRDSCLETTFAANETRHVLYVSDAARGLRRHRVEETWKREKQLGRGGFGSVWLERRVRGTDGTRAELRAVKEIGKPPAGGEGEDESRRIDYTRELEAVAKFSHEKYRHCFVTSTGWFENESAIFIAMEYLSHGDLKAHMTRKFPEVEARTIASQLVEALNYLHDNDFAHRDLKPNNVLVVHTGPDWWVKLADFGISKRVGSSLTTHTGWATEGFVAPEVLHIYPEGYDGKAASYPFAVDIWALAEMVFRLLVIRPVFYGPGELVLYVRGEHPFPAEALRSSALSEQCNLFIQSAMTANPSLRPMAAHIQQHAWLVGSGEHNMKESEVAHCQLESDVAAITPDEPRISLDTTLPVATEFSNSWTTVDPTRESNQDGHDAALTPQPNPLLESNIEVGEAGTRVNSAAFGIAEDGEVHSLLAREYVERQTQQARPREPYMKVALFRGNLVLDCPVPDLLLSQITHGKRDEFTHMRYLAVTCHPSEFLAENFVLRQSIFARPRETALLIAIILNDENDALLCRTLIWVLENITYMRNRQQSQTWGRDTWKKIVVCIVGSERAMSRSTGPGILTTMGLYRDDIAKHSINGKLVTASVYEYTSQCGLKLENGIACVVPCRAGQVDYPMQMLLCLRRQTDIDARQWVLDAFLPALEAHTCIFVNAGTALEKNSLYNRWSQMTSGPSTTRVTDLRPPQPSRSKAWNYWPWR